MVVVGPDNRRVLASISPAERSVVTAPTRAIPRKRARQSFGALATVSRVQRLTVTLLFHSHHVVGLIPEP
jgi:hypothetical protein